jgi:K+-transporting ATPase A subunit
MKKQLQNMKYFNYLVSPITSDAKYTSIVISMTAMSKAAYKKKVMKKKKTISPTNWTYVEERS